MNVSPATKAVALEARKSFSPFDFAGHAQEVARNVFRLLTLVRYGKAEPSIAVDLIRRIRNDNAGSLPWQLDRDLSITADRLAGATWR